MMQNLNAGKIGPIQTNGQVALRRRGIGKVLSADDMRHPEKPVIRQAGDLVCRQSVAPPDHKVGKDKIIGRSNTPGDLRIDERTMLISESRWIEAGKGFQIAPGFSAGEEVVPRF